MDLNEFYKQVDGIVMFPGSVEELNRLEFSKKSGRSYSIVPLEGNRTFFTGVIVPSKEELREMICVMKGVAVGFAALRGEEAASAQKELEEEIESELEPVLHQLLGSPALMDLDLRLKAKKLGADGVVHVQMYNKDGMYFGVPVKQHTFATEPPKYTGNLSTV
ncbi:hypothetical protein HY837_03760 [archaeon]|nr:hypothetical protein [archaeon]